LLENSRERKLLGAKVPHHFSSWVRKFSGAKVSGSKSSIYGTFIPSSKSTWERKFHNSGSGLRLELWWSCLFAQSLSKM